MGDHWEVVIPASMLEPTPVTPIDELQELIDKKELERSTAKYLDEWLRFIGADPRVEASVQCRCGCGYTIAGDGEAVER